MSFGVKLFIILFLIAMFVVLLVIAAGKLEDKNNGGRY